ncbi:hypothetical protein [Streptomyces sp. NRRL S-118]|uniref:hypothetical protein n=1 Tax=Streptomyces sp. NRRL S-118 TaxID=1463881 RepID=UPI0004C82753|nr:hypothetical protein [Streptomyces sp. NRRL S-118]
MRTERRTSTARVAAAALISLALPVLAACDADGGTADAAPPTATGTLEQLAAKAACEPEISTDAEELRQAKCETRDGAYVLTTFATDRGQREWINEANDYGGTYLVGRKWVVSGDEKVVTALRGRLGGDVETGSSHHSGNSGGGGDEGSHSGHHAS